MLTSNVRIAENDSVAEMAAMIFRVCVPCSIGERSIAIDSHLNRISVAYGFQSGATGGMHSRIQFTVHEQNNEAWIGDLFVKPDLRLSGAGTQLVRAAESLVVKLDVAAINVWPLNRSEGFWQKMGYSPHQSISRALSKRVTRSCNRPS